MGSTRNDIQVDIAMQALFDIFFSEIDRLFDKEWVVLWLLDDF